MGTAGRDKGKYLGRGVTQAVESINEKLADELCGMDALDQTAIDQRMIELDGTENKKNLGANAVLGISLAVAHAAADHRDCRCSGTWAEWEPASCPHRMNIVNGGKHADNAVDIQEFMVMSPGSDFFSDAIRCGVEVFHNLEKELQSRKLSTNVGDEGGFAPT